MSSFIPTNNTLVSFAILAVVAGLASGAAFYGSNEIKRYAATLPPPVEPVTTTGGISDPVLAKAKMYTDTAALLALATAVGALVAIIYYNSQQKKLSSLCI